MTNKDEFVAHKNTWVAPKSHQKTMEFKNRMQMKSKNADIPVNDDIIEKKSFLSKLKNTINTYTNMKGGNIEHRRNIEIYKIIGDIVSPLSCCHDKFSKTNKGDFVLIIDDSVWIQDDNPDMVEQYSEVSYSPEFVRINTTLFKKI